MNQEHSSFSCVFDSKIIHCIRLKEQSLLSVSTLKKGFVKAIAKTGKIAKEGFNTVKTLKAGVDNSVIFIQNGPVQMSFFNFLC